MRTHGGQAAQAKRRREEWIICSDCTTHRFRPTQVVDVEEPATWPRIAGMTIFVLVLFASIAYALPVIAMAVRS